MLVGSILSSGIYLFINQMVNKLSFYFTFFFKLFTSGYNNYLKLQLLVGFKQVSNSRRRLLHNLLLSPLWVPTTGTKESRLDKQEVKYTKIAASYKKSCVEAITLIQQIIFCQLKSVFFFSEQALKLLRTDNQLPHVSYLRF